MVRALKRDARGRWRYLGRGDPPKGAFATASDIDAYRSRQRRNGRKTHVRNRQSLQNSIATTALKLDVSVQEAQSLWAEWLNDRDQAIESGTQIPAVPGSP